MYDKTCLIAAFSFSVLSIVASDNLDLLRPVPVKPISTLVVNFDISGSPEVIVDTQKTPEVVARIREENDAHFSKEQEKIRSDFVEDLIDRARWINRESLGLVHQLRKLNDAILKEEEEQFAKIESSIDKALQLLEKYKK